MRNNKGRVLIGIIIAVILIAILAVLIWVGIAVMNSVEEDNQNKVVSKSNQNYYTSEQDFENMLVEYILDSIEVYSTTGYLLKDTSGDLTAERLSYEEAKANRTKYKQKIMNMLSDSKFFGKKFEIENKEACTFNFVNILTELGIGGYPGLGIGCTDFEGNKVYIYNNTLIDDASNSDVLEYFGCNVNELKNNIEDQIEEQVIKGNIIKSIDGLKLTVEELEDNKEEYKQKMLNDVRDEVYYNDGVVSCKYWFSEVLRSLDLESTVEETEMETFVFTEYTINPKYYQSK